MFPQLVTCLAEIQPEDNPEKSNLTGCVSVLASSMRTKLCEKQTLRTGAHLITAGAWRQAALDEGEGGLVQFGPSHLLRSFRHGHAVLVRQQDPRRLGKAIDRTDGYLLK